jgi:hypothetical protein
VKSVLQSVTDTRPDAFLDGLRSELGRLRFAQMASFIHPNERGARRIADRKGWVGAEGAPEGLTAAFDPFDIPLGEITRISLTALPFPGVGIKVLPRFGQVTVFLNGRRFASTTFEEARKPGDTLLLWEAG